MTSPLKPADRIHISKIKELGCIVHEAARANGDFCEGYIEYNHISVCGRRLGHRYGYPLCSKHHRYGKISIHNAKKTFIATYGTQEDLMRKAWALIGYSESIE